MPQLTISINAPGLELDTDILNIEISLDITIKDLKGFIEASTNIPSASQHVLLHMQRIENDEQTLEQAGIKDGEMISVIVQKPKSARTNARHGQDRSSTQHDAEPMRQRVLNDGELQNQLKQGSPELFAALSDPAQWQRAWQARRREEAEAQQQHVDKINELNSDPYNVEKQKEIFERIRLQNVMQNAQQAYEHNPEVFVRVHMLYINTEVNGVPVKAFVDSGAQATIMSPDCAERCGIMRLLDTRYSGMARGVGTATILGRVHKAEIKIGGAVMPCAFTVMEGKDVDLLFGLDMLKRYRARIDLEKNALCLEGIEVPFLHESEIPKSFEEAEPTIPGPDGTEIGTQTGAIRPKGATAAGEPAVAVGPSGNASSSEPSSSQPGPESQANIPHITPQIQQLITHTRCSPEVAARALEMCEGNVDAAAAMILGI